MAAGQPLPVLPPDWAAKPPPAAAFRRVAPAPAAAASRSAPGFAAAVTDPVQPQAAPRPPRLLLVGAHGGAGVSTLARLLTPALDAGVARDWRLLCNPAGEPVALVSGCTVAATGHAVREVGAAARAGVVIRLLLVVGDGWPVPRPARARLRLLAAHVGRVVQVPYVPAWRHLERPDLADLPRTLARTLTDARARLDNPAHTRP